MEKRAEVLRCNGITYEVVATEGLLTFCQRLAEMEAAAGLPVTFDDAVVHQMAEVVHKQQHEVQSSACAEEP